MPLMLLFKLLTLKVKKSACLPERVSEVSGIIRCLKEVFDEIPTVSDRGMAYFMLRTIKIRRVTQHNFFLIFALSTIRPVVSCFLFLCCCHGLRDQQDLRGGDTPEN